VDVGELAGTRVMVTGATSGLGAAMATALSAAGARVVATRITLQLPARLMPAAHSSRPLGLAGTSTACSRRTLSGTISRARS
jgi:NAD(P)-dependent dehydrogenase (short-subunit alcohol dehydrogenase family)